MSNDTIYSAEGEIHAELLMPKLRSLEDSLKKDGDPTLALEAYVVAWREAIVHEMFVGGDAKESLGKYPSLDGVFRWAVMENKVRLVDACVDMGAEVDNDQHWAISYAVAQDYDEVTEVLISKGKADLFGALKAWEDETRDGSEGLRAMLRELAQGLSPKEHVPVVSPESIEQLTLIA